MLTAGNLAAATTLWYAGKKDRTVKGWKQRGRKDAGCKPGPWNAFFLGWRLCCSLAPVSRRVTRPYSHSG